MTDNQKKPFPTATLTGPKVCPVCGRASYSAAGIHPQCAAVQADAPRNERLKAGKKADAQRKAKQAGKQRSWSKKCPKCHVDVHARRKVCDCGHDFSR